MSENPLARDVHHAYLRAMRAQDRAAALAAIDRGLGLRLDAATLLLDVLGRSQHEIGEAWHRGEVSVAEEHWATTTTEEIASWLRTRLPSRARTGRSAVLAIPEGEPHTLPIRLFGYLLDVRGWNVDDLGHGVPAADLARFVAARRPSVVGLSATLPASLERLRAQAEAIRDLPDPPPILVGGSAFGRSPDLPDGFPADAVAADALEGLAAAERLAGPPGPADIPSYLAQVAGRLRELRHSAGRTQADVAQDAGLTRPYLSAVESGSQNITLEAAFKLATALGVSVTHLLGGDG